LERLIRGAYARGFLSGRGSSRDGDDVASEFVPLPPWNFADGLFGLMRASGGGGVGRECAPIQLGIVLISGRVRGLLDDDCGLACVGALTRSPWFSRDECGWRVDLLSEDVVAGDCGGADRKKESARRWWWQCTEFGRRRIGRELTA